MAKKMGRPTDNPKPYKITVRIDAQCKSILSKYCDQYAVNQMEAVRRGISKLQDDLKK